MAQPSRLPDPAFWRARAWALRRFRLSRKADAKRSPCGPLSAGLGPGLGWFFGKSGLLDDMTTLWQRCAPSYRRQPPRSIALVGTRGQLAARRASRASIRRWNARISWRWRRRLRNCCHQPRIAMIMTNLPWSNRIRCPRVLAAEYRFAVIERWLNCGKLMKTAESQGFSGPCLG